MDLNRLYNLIDKSIKSHDKRAADIVVNRYGLESEGYRTLASLGEDYDLTRERVRQIQDATVGAIRSELKRHKEIMAFLKFIHSHLDKMDGLRRSDLLVQDVINLKNVDSNEQILKNRLHFIAEIAGEPTVVSSDDKWHDVWHNDKEAYEIAKALAKHLDQFNDHDFDKFVGHAKDKFDLPKDTIVNYLHISKNFGKGPYGDLGAKHWVHINPKTTRDKNYLVLSRASKPLHFREIADLVNSLDGVKPSHPDTVHNELIKDDRFKLVGRGMYALK